MNNGNIRSAAQCDQTPLKDKRFAAKYFDVSVGTVDRWIASGRGPRFIKVGNLVRFRIEDLADFVERNARGGQHQQVMT